MFLVRGVVVALVREQLKDGPKSAAAIMAAAEAAEISEIALGRRVCAKPAAAQATASQTSR